MKDYRVVVAMTLKAPDERTARKVASAIVTGFEGGSSKAAPIEHVELMELAEK
jgi:hypothetical protein